MPEAFAIKPEDPSSDDRWIIPGSDLRPPIKNSWALYMDTDRDDPMDLRTAAATIMKEWAGITSLDGRVFSGREQRAMDPREYYKLAIGAFKAGSLTSLFSEEWAEFHEAEGKGDKAGTRALAKAKIKGEGVGAKVASAVDRNIHNTNASELGSMRKALGTVRDVMSPEDIDTLEHPYRLGLGYVQGVTGLYEKYHEAIEDERRVERYRKQLADENQWAVIESIKPHVSDNARKVLEMALQSADEPTNSAVMKEFEKLSTPEMRSIAGALQALHYDRDPDFKALCADAGRAFCNTLGMVTVGAVRGATDLVRRTWMDSAEYRDMVDRRVMLEDANRERMADWGIVGNAVIGAASTIPYMAAAAIPYVGMADMMLTARDEFQSQAARNGVDVSSPDFILGSSAFAIAYAYVEKIQWEKAFGGIANLSRRQMYCDVFHSVRAALGVAGAFAGTVLTESGEEGIQAALEEAATHWGQGTTLADEVKAFTEDFVGSLGTMAIIGAFGGAKQGLAYRHGALGFDVADALAAQSRILELDRHMAGHPGEVGPLASYGRTYGRMVEDWIEAGTDVERRQASLMRWGLTKDQAVAIHGALQNIWTSIEGSDASAERKAEQKSALIGGGHVLTPGEMIASIQNGDYRGKIETRADGSQAVDLSIAGKTLRMVVQPKREAARIDENDTAMFESIVNELNDRNFVDADGAQFTVEGWKQLAPEERRTIIDQADLAVQGNVTFEDMDGNRLDGRVLDAITGQVHMTDEALPQTAFHETMHGVLRILTDMARGEKDESGAWKVEPDSAAAALVGELGTLFKPRSDREAVDEERLSNAFQRYLTGKIRAVEHTGLFDRLGRFLARLFGYGGRTYEIENARTAHERLFNTAITGHIAQALQGAESVQRPQAPAAATGGQAATVAAEGQEPPTAQVAGDILGQLEADYPELAPLAAMFRNRDTLDHQQMAQLVKATGERLTTDMVWAAGYRWNGVQERWEYDERLERPVDDRDRPQQPFQGADGEIHVPEAEGPSSAPEGPSSETEGTKQERNSVAPRLPSPEFAMDGTIVDALPAHLREDGRAIVAERGGTAAWMVEADGTPTELNEREWLRREAERRHGAGRYAVSGRAPTAEEVAETQRQYDDVVARFTNPDGTKKAGWLMAPNGKPTRLTEQHWVQVRTENFKRWFGDWEAADLQRFLEGPAVGTAAGNEFAGSSRDAVALEMRAFFDSLGGVAANQFLGDVQLTHKGINDTIRKGMGRLKYAAFKLVPAIIENGRVVQVDANWKQRGYGTAVIAAPIAIGTIPHVAVVVIHRYQNGDQNFYLHEVSPLSVLKKGIAGLRSSLAEGGEGGSSRDFSNILARPLFSVNPDSVSKVVDENGEPLVAWHGSRWNPLEEKPGDAVFGKSSTPSQGSYLKDRQGFFFANKEVAEGYGVNDPMAFFINAREPYTVDVRDELRELDYDIETEREEAEAAGYPIGRWLGEGDEEFEANDSATAYLDDNMSEIMARSDENRADAVLVKGADGSFVAVVFDPTQIKSATDNVGTFDSANPDIRYQIAGRAGAERLGIRGLGDAEAMERSGATREDIWRETGWWRGKDGKWRVEIGDIELSADWKEKVKAGCQLRDIVSGPAIDAYDDAIGGVFVSVDNSLKGTETAAVFNIRLGTIRLRPDQTKSKSGFVESLAHEIQHVIQSEEGFERGTSFAWQMEARERQIDMTAFPNAWFEYEQRNREFIPVVAKFVQSIAEPWLRYVHDATIDEKGRVKFPYETKDEIPRINGRMIRSMSDFAKGIEKKLNRWKSFDAGSLARNSDLADVLRRVGADELGWFLSDSMKESFGEEYTKWASDAQEAYAAMAAEAAAKIAEADAVVKEISRPLEKAFADARNAYYSAGGEIEARMVEARMHLTEEQRREIPPWVTEQVVRQDRDAKLADYSYENQRAAMGANIRHAVAPAGEQKQAGTAYPDAGGEIGDRRFAVGAKRRADYKALLEKKRPDLDAGKVLAELDKFNSPKKEKAALHWTILGTIQLPQDEYKVEDALSVAAKAKVDPLKYRSPLELIEAHREFKPTAKPIDPDTVPELDGKMDDGDGITIYVVEDSKAGQLAMRRIIDTHWGEEANPWCLLEREEPEETYDFSTWRHWQEKDARKAGVSVDVDALAAKYERETGKKPYVEGSDLKKAWEWWQKYSALPKLVAFKNGKLLAFMATEGLNEENDPFGDDIGARLPDLQEEYEDWLESEEGQEESAGFYDWLRVNHPEELEEASTWEEWWDRMDESHPGLEWARDQRYSITSDALAVALDALLDGGKIDIRIAGDKRDAAIVAAKDFHARYGEMRLPISTGRTMFFAPSRESVTRHGGDEAAAWAEYALHAVTNDNVDKSGKHYRAFSKEKIEKVMPRIPEIVAADMTAIDKNRVLFFYELDERHIARLVAQPENGNLRVDDLVEVTATYAKGKTPGTAMPLARAIAEWTSRGDTPDSATVDGNQPQPDADGKSENARGSVAGRDPGWWDAEGQADAAAREARDAARHGLSFGGPSFSHRSYVEAFAARDRALGFKRSDADYKRLIDAFGLTGKMTVADAKSAGEALQAEMHGAAATLADLVKQAEKKNFRKTVDRMIMGAAGYGIEVGANAHRAWAEYVSRMRRLAQGGNAQELRTGWGLDFAAMLFAAGPEGFEAKEHGKAKGGGEAVAGDDEAAALEGALIDGREGELGFTAEEAKARLAELLEAKKGDVAARNARLHSRLEEWRKQEAARQAALLARQEAEAARKAEKEDKDGDTDREGDGKGDRPQERDEEEAVAEMPDFQAFIKALQEDGWDLSNPGEFAAVLRFYVEDWLSEKYGVAPSDVMKDPVAAAQYRKTVLEILRDACNQLLDPNDGQAVRIAERMLGEIPGDASAAEIEGRSRSIIGFIKRNAIRQSRKQLVNGIIADIKKLAIQGRMFDETEKDIGRKITGEREPYARYVARILMWGDKRIADEMARLNDIISGRLDAYRASRAEDAALEDLQRTDREIHRATERLAALQLWGGLRKKSPAEIALAGRQIHQWLETERNEHEKRWGEWKAGLDRKAEALAKAFSAGRADYTPDDPGFVGELADGLTTNFKMRLERMAVGSGTEGRQAIEEVMMLIYGGSERLGVLKAARRERTDAMLERCVEGTGTTVGDFIKSLGENIPEELNRQLATEDQPVRMTWGQALQLLGSLEQTASYAMNIEENGREGHRDLILAAVADKPQMLRLLEELRKIYEEDREAISQEFFAVTGNPILAPDPLYLPARMYTGARDNLETSVRAWNPFGPAFTPRIRNKRDFDLSASIMDVYNSRMKETATALAFGMRGMELRSILARKSVQEAIARTHGKFALRKMIAQLTDIVSDGYKGDGGQMEWYRRAIRTLGDITTYSALSWNAVTMLKQMTSIPAWTALLDGGYGEIFRHITNFDAEAARELCRSPGFVARYGATGFGKMFRQELENPQGGNVLARLFKAGMTAVQMGDFVPGILVGTGVYKARKLALMNRGMGEGAAREQAARETWGLIEENQQSSRLENTPEILRRGGFIGRQLSKFATSPMMQVAHEMHTLRMWIAEAKLEARHGGKESSAVRAMMNAQGDDALRWRRRFVNQVVCNHVLMPAAMYAIAAIFKRCLGGEPPDREEIYGDLVMQMVAGPWSRIFLVGAIADQTGEWVARMAGGKPNVYARGDLAATQHLHKALAQVGRIGGDVADMDWVSVRDDFVKMAASYNAPFRYAATAVQNAAGYDPAKARRERKKEIRERKAAAGE